MHYYVLVVCTGLLYSNNNIRKQLTITMQQLDNSLTSQVYIRSENILAVLLEHIAILCAKSKVKVSKLVLLQ